MENERAERLFWDAIRKSYRYNKIDWRAYNKETHLERLTQYLSNYSKEDLILFEKTLEEKLGALYTAEIMELSIILEGKYTKEGEKYSFDGYISTDGFIYFRCWLLLKGETFFEDITKDIECFVSGKYHFDIGDMEAEGLLYVADAANRIARPDDDRFAIREAVYKQWPAIHYDNGDYQANREPKDGTALQEMYPKLVEEIMSIR